MTEEEKVLYIDRESKRLHGNFPELPEGMIDAIIEWNINRKSEWVTDTLIDWVSEVAHSYRTHINYSELLSENSEVAYGTLIMIIGRALAKDVCMTPRLELMFERYVFNIMNLKWGDGRTADEVKPFMKAE